jgi:hypothetical protein
MSSTDIAQRGAGASAALMTEAHYDTTSRLAKALAASGVFKDAREWQQAFAKILMGKDLGLTPVQSLMGLDIVEGNLQMRGVLLGSFIRDSGKYEYKLLEHTNEGAEVMFLGFPQDEKEEGFVKRAGRYWEVLGIETFTIADAAKAGLVKPKSNWEKYPKNMNVWRCLSNGVKFLMPDLMKGIAVYTEADSFDDQEGVHGAIDAPSAPDDPMEVVRWVGTVGAEAGISGEVVNRMAAAAQECNELAPGSFSLAKAQMTLMGRDESGWWEQTTALERQIQEMRERAERASAEAPKSEPEVPDAEVVTPEDPEALWPVWEELADRETAAEILQSLYDARAVSEEPNPAMEASIAEGEAFLESLPEEES